MFIKNQLPDDARVWIYQTDRALNDTETLEIQVKLNDFARSWVSHQQQLVADATIISERFVVLMVDEKMAGASGCSIDKSVRFLQEIEQTYDIQLFNRLFFIYKDQNGQLQSANKTTFKTLFVEKKINADTIVYDTLLQSKKDFNTDFEKKLAESWHQRLLK